MNNKKLAYVLLPAILGISFLGVNVASAHGWFGGMGALSADEVASRQQTMFQQEADILGISVDEVKNAWAEGKTFQQLAQEKGISQDELHKRMSTKQLDSVKSQLQSLVDKGVITQAQADKRLQVMQTRMENKGGRMGKGMKGMHQAFMF